MDSKSIQALLAKTDLKISEMDNKYDQRIKDLITSLEFTQATVDDMKSKLTHYEEENKRLSSEINVVNHENTSLRTQLKEREERLDYLDDQGRRNNLRICGVPEEQNENWEQCQHKVTKMLKDKLNVNPSFERVHRVGKFSPQQTRPRDIVAKFSSFPNREAAFRERRKLKGTNIYLNEDLCPGSTAARREQLGRLHAARREGKIAYFNYRTLVVKEAHPHQPGRQEGPTHRPTHSARSSPQSPGRTSPTTTSTTSTSPRRAPAPETTPNTTSTSDFPDLAGSTHSRPANDLSLPAPLSTRGDPHSSSERRSQRNTNRH